jgi:FKBP-type peptidyl-prolyl cis-trans isomerase FklB
MKIRLSITAILLLLSWSVFAAEEKSTTVDKDKFSYAIGYQIGQSLKRDALNVDIKTLSKAIEDVLKDEKLKYSTDEMQAAMESYQKQQVAERKASAGKNKKAGEDFLAENKKKKGVKVTDSGLQYKVIKEGKGDKPKATDTVVVNYRGTLINGKEFDSSYSRGKPVTFAVNRVIKGWQEALQLMKVGAKWKVFIPSDLAYGERGAGGSIGPNETLVFDVELVEIKKEPKK